RPQMWCVRLSAVDVQRDRHLADSRPKEARLDDHLGGELHAGTTLTQTFVVHPTESPEPAVHVLDRGAEPAARQPGEHRVSPPPMKKRHRAGHYASTSGGKAATLHEVIPFAKLRQESGDLSEVVAVVGVAHHHVATARRSDSAHQRASVTLLGNWDDTRAKRGRDFLRPVRASIVGDDHLARDLMLAQRLHRLADA